MVPDALGEPQIAIRALGDQIRRATRSGSREFGDHTSRRDSSHFAAVLLTPLREPQIAIWSGCDPYRIAAGGGDRKLRDRPGGGNSSDLVSELFCEPQIAVRAGS